VLVFPEAFGLGPHAESRAERLAGLGYVALACDLHGEGRVLSDLKEVMSLIEPLRADPLRTRARSSAALDALAGRAEVDSSKIAAIGFCFSGTMALELAWGGASMVGVVGFHSGLATTRPDDAKNIRGRVLVCISADDPGISPEQRLAFEQEMREGLVHWQMNLYGGVVHSFTNPVAGISIEAVPMYNLQRGPAAGQLFHPKGRGNGYVLTLGAKRVYIAGDTECTDEMRALKGIDIAFIPMNLPYTMPPSEAAECVKAFKPKVVYPYHYRGQNPEEFKAALKGEPVEVRLLNWYPSEPAGRAKQ
jgi:dienelactone hydrolase